MKTGPRPKSHDALCLGGLHQLSSLLQLLHLEIQIIALLLMMLIIGIDLQTRGQRLLKLFSLLLVGDLQCVEES